MDLKEYYDREVVIITDDGQIFSGFVDEYIYPEDNENEKESIILKTKQVLVEFYEEDIKDIVVLGGDN